jgi:hypothetical protein
LKSVITRPRNRFIRSWVARRNEEKRNLISQESRFPFTLSTQKLGGPVYTEGEEEREEKQYEIQGKKDMKRR